MTLSRPKLSVLIPTLNRPKYIKKLFEEISPLRASIDFELVVSDNASDLSYAAEIEYGRNTLGLNISYHRYEFRVDVMDNILRCMDRARGEYHIYCADDDRLILENLLDAISLLDQSIESSAIVSPLEFYKCYGSADAVVIPDLPSAHILQRGERRELVSKLADHAFMAEAILYRSDAIGPVTVIDNRMYIFFYILDKAISSGDVILYPSPIYRFIGSYGLDDDRAQVGREMIRREEFWKNIQHSLYILADVGYGFDDAGTVNSVLNSVNKFLSRYLPQQLVVYGYEYSKIHESLSLLRVLRATGCFDSSNKILSNSPELNFNLANMAAIKVIENYIIRQYDGNAMLLLKGFPHQHEIYTHLGDYLSPGSASNQNVVSVHFDADEPEADFNFSKLVRSLAVP